MMLPLVRFGFVLLLLQFLVVTWAQVPVPNLSQRVTDLTATLTAFQVNTLENKLKTFEAKQGSQIAVLIVPTTQPEDIAQFGIRVADAWKIGREDVDDGVILIIAKDDRKLRLEVGYGLEGAIPDAIAKRVIAETITPHFKTGDFVGGIDAGVTQLMRLIEGEALPVPQQKRSSRQTDVAFIFLLIVSVFAGYVLSAIVGRVTGGILAGLGSGIVYTLMFGYGFAMVLTGLIVFYIVGVRHHGGSGWSSGDGFFDDSGFGGDSWEGGGGDFGGGGASGSW